MLAYIPYMDHMGIAIDGPFRGGNDCGFELQSLGLRRAVVGAAPGHRRSGLLNGTRGRRSGGSNLFKGVPQNHPFIDG